jgi:hypothetical protein
VRFRAINVPAVRTKWPNLDHGRTARIVTARWKMP